MNTDSTERRVVIFAPRGRDASVVQSVLLAADIDSIACERETELLAQLGAGGAAAILTEEVLSDSCTKSLGDWLQQQPAWSDFPFVVLATKQAQRRSRRATASLQELGNVILLERPVNAQTLASAADAAVRARARQYVTRKHLEDLGEARAAVERLNRELEDRIGARTRELASANDRLMAEIAERERVQATLLHVQKMEALGRLTGGIAHDFNNLLHAVNMSLDMIARRSIEPNVASIATRAKGPVGRGASLTRQLLSFARRQSLVARPTDVAALVAGIKDLVELSVGSSIAVSLQVDADLAWAGLDANQLEMAVLNLTGNARDAMPRGGQLTLSVRRRHAAESTLPAGDYVVVAVSDTGEGIAPGLLAKVFDPFFTTKPLGRGTGLGLSQVYGFAKQSGGQALLQSRLGEGTTVEMWFPSVPVPPVAAPAPSAPMAALSNAEGHRRRRVLVVEDDLDVRRVIVESLSLMGYEVTEAADGAAGLASISARRPDLLVVDYAMPGINGAELIERAREAVGDLPVILATGYADMAEVGKVLGTKSILIKPFDISTLADAVTTALGAQPVASHG